MYELVVQTAFLAEVDFVAIMEVQSNVGLDVGEAVAGRISNFYYHESNQFVKHSEQYLAVWDTTKMASTDVFLEFPGLEFPNAAYRPPLMFMMNIAQLANNIPIVIFHAPAPSDPNVVAGCANLAQIHEIATGNSGLLMGDFNISPSDPVSNPRAYNAFGPLLNLGYSQATVNVKTSLVQSVPPNATFQDCLSSEYDNFFIKINAAGTHVTWVADVFDLLSPCVIGDPEFFGNYDLLFRSWVGYRDTGVNQMCAPINSIAEAHDAYRRTVSDHLPVKLTLSW